MCVCVCSCTGLETGNEHALDWKCVGYRLYTRNDKTGITGMYRKVCVCVWRVSTGAGTENIRKERGRHISSYMNLLYVDVEHSPANPDALRGLLPQL